MLKLEIACGKTLIWINTVGVTQVQTMVKIYLLNLLDLLAFRKVWYLFLVFFFCTLPCKPGSSDLKNTCLTVLSPHLLNSILFL